MDEHLLSAILERAQKRFCRFPLVLSGERSWCLASLHSLLGSQDLKQVIFVSTQETLLGATCVPANKLKGRLGGECRLLVWDGFAGFNPDALGAASGLIQGGGLFIFLTPPLHELARSPDPDYSRMCASEEELSGTSTYFLERLVSFFGEDNCLLIRQDSTSTPSLPCFDGSVGRQTLPTIDQVKAINAITHVVEGHRRRPLVITADRGRGKSSALGIAAAKLVLKYNQTILLSAPSKQACAQVFKHYVETFEKQGFKPEDYKRYLSFISPDELLTTKPICQLLLVDEAAGIPAPLLSELLDHYSRLVFSTTIHGYEGNGQGFAIRFRKQLDLKTPGWKNLHLNQAVRWAENDPLEDWISKLLLLSLGEHTFSDSLVIEEDVSDVVLMWPSQEELANKPDLLEQIVDLLVNAHYQTSPDDIRMILDHPGIHVACGVSKTELRNDQAELISALLLIQEGKLDPPDLRQDILGGKRRLRGHLVPQSLATFSGNEEYLTLSSLRVMRIAVKAKYENQGIGSQMIKAAYQYAHELGVDYFSTAFGLTPELLYFWQKNQFSLLKLGIQRDSASACYAAIMLRPISKQAQLQAECLQALFAQQLVFGSSRQYRNHSATTLLNAIRAVNVPEALCKLNERELQKIKRFANINLTIEDCMSELVKLIFFFFRNKPAQHSNLERLEQNSQLLLVRRVLQGHSVSTCVSEFNLNGKKELDRKLRKAVTTLLQDIVKC